MQRRDFITLVGCAALTWPLATRAQQPKVARIGALYIGVADEEAFQRELREGLREQGYVEGRDIGFEFRSAENKLDRLPELAAGLVRRQIDVIVTLYVPCTLAAYHATSGISIARLA